MRMGSTGLTLVRGAISRHEFKLPLGRFPCFRESAMLFSNGVLDVPMTAPP